MSGSRHPYLALEDARLIPNGIAVPVIQWAAVNIHLVVERSVNVGIRIIRIWHIHSNFIFEYALPNGDQGSATEA